MRIFVYGTLKRGYWNNRLLLRIGAKFLRTDKAPGLLYGGIIPHATPGAGWIKGELWEVPDELVQMVDRLEGHPSAYTRITIKTSSGRKAEIYYWLHLSDHCVRPELLVPSGKWHYEREEALA